MIIFIDLGWCPNKRFVLCLVCVCGEGVSQIRHSVIQVPKEIFKQNDILDIKTTIQA